MARSHEGRVLLDLRTVPPAADVELTKLLKQAVESAGRDLKDHP